MSSSSAQPPPLDGAKNIDVGWRELSICPDCGSNAGEAVVPGVISKIRFAASLMVPVVSCPCRCSDCGKAYSVSFRRELVRGAYRARCNPLLYPAGTLVLAGAWLTVLSTLLLGGGFAIGLLAAVLKSDWMHQVWVGALYGFLATAAIGAVVGYLHRCPTCRKHPTKDGRMPFGWYSTLSQAWATRDDHDPNLSAILYRDFLCLHCGQLFTLDADRCEPVTPATGAESPSAAPPPLPKKPTGPPGADLHEAAYLRKALRLLEDTVGWKTREMQAEMTSVGGTFIVPAIVERGGEVAAVFSFDGEWSRDATRRFLDWRTCCQVCEKTKAFSIIVAHAHDPQQLKRVVGERGNVTFVAVPATEERDS